MTEFTGRPLDDALVARLLSLKKNPEREAYCEEIGLLAAVLAGDSGGGSRRAADAHLAACPSCREALLILGQLAATGGLGPLPSADFSEFGHRPEPLRLKWSTRRMLVAAAALFLVTAGAVFIWSSHRSRPDRSMTALSVKGDSDGLFVAVQRGVSQYTLQPMDTLRAGDVIGLFYSAKTEGYLAVFGLDSRRDITLLYPSNHSRSARIPPADRAPLSDGATVKGGKGCEWLVGVFSDAPLDLNEVAETLRQGTNGRERCDLLVRIPGARSVQVVPFLI